MLPPASIKLSQGFNRKRGWMMTCGVHESRSYPSVTVHARGHGTNCVIHPSLAK